MFLIALSEESFAAREIYQARVAEEIIVASFSGEVGEQWGEEIVKGDFNGDGIEDLAFSAPLASMTDRKWNGEVKVLLGSKDRKANTISIFGEAGGDQLGRALAVGDFNGDKVDDLAIGAHNAYNKGERLGKVYIIDSKVISGSQNLDLALDKTISTVHGLEENEAFGLEIAVDDLDLNGKDDLVVGAPLAGFSGQNQSGAAYLFLNFGNSFGVPRVFLGNQEKERFGSAITTGQLMGDDYPELIISGYKAKNGLSTQNGAVYIYKGEKSFPLEGKRVFQTLSGENEGEWFGFALATDDVNGDGFEDLAVSSFPYWEGGDNGGIEVFEGSLEGIKNEALMSLKGSEGDRMGAYDFVIEDFNADGVKELIFGAPGVNMVAKSDYEGAVYFADLQKGDFDLNARDYRAVMYGAQADDWFGSSLVVGDFDGNGLKDLVVGAIYTDGDFADSGEVYVIYGDGGYFGLKGEFIDPEKEVSRGALVKEVIDGFELRESKKEKIAECLEFAEFCLFNFSAASNFDEMEIGESLVLYPDVRPGSKYYEEVNLATILGIINGYMRDKDSPFRPEGPVTRIQALKVVLGATDLVKFKYQFELIKELGSYEALSGQNSGFSDVSGDIPYMWWYPRYTRFALDNSLIDNTLLFRPDEYISKEELADLIKRTKEFISAEDEEDSK